jgi:hypothetical protein
MKLFFKLSFNTMSDRIRLIGVIFILVGLIVNPFTWVEIFDADGYLTESNKIKIWIFDTLNILFGFLLIYKSYSSIHYLNSNKFKKIVSRYYRNLGYLIYLVITIEIGSYFILKMLLPDNVINRVNLVLGESTKQSTDISWQTADLWSNYKPNPLSKRCNQYGYRYGGGPKEKGRIRILCVGGSTTWGDGVAWGYDSYPAQLEKYLNNNGYSVDIVNSGVPYYTSAEVLTSLCFRGIHTKPDIVLIHTGGNDIGPLCSPDEYKSDYSHWRRVGGIISDNVFTEYYYKFPFSTFRLFLIYYLKPGTGNSVGDQISYPKLEMLSKTNLEKIKPVGLITNFRNIISVSKASGAKPIVILFNTDQDRKNSLALQYFGNSDDFTFARNRNHKALHINNGVMDSIANALNIPVISFDKWNPKDLQSWIDHCHLDSTGIMEKARFIGNYLIKNQILMADNK